VQAVDCAAQRASNCWGESVAVAAAAAAACLACVQIEKRLDDYVESQVKQENEKK
jgi:hypothetical protein